MECHKCKEDKNYFTEMYFVDIYKGLPKKPVCIECLGWKTKHGDNWGSSWKKEKGDNNDT
jgi:hypothetical protein